MDDIEIEFPLELVVHGVPVSQQASIRSQQDWKRQIREAASDRVSPGLWATAEPVVVTIFYFSPAAMRGDIDNIVKPILDSLERLIYVGDRQVELLLIGKREPGREVGFPNPTAILVQAIAAQPPCLYIRIDDDRSRESLSWYTALKWA